MSFRLDYKIAADPAKFIDGINRAMAKQEEMNQGAKRFNQTGEKGTKIFDGMLGKLAGFASIGAAIGIATRALGDMRDTAVGAARGVEMLEERLKRQIQISGGSDAQLQERKRVARELRLRYGFTGDAAEALTFQGASLSLSPQKVLELGAYKAFAADVGPLFEGMAGIRAAFGPEAAGGRPESVMNALLAAAEKSKVSVEQIAAIALTPAQQVKRLGGTAEETLAALSVATIALASPEMAATSVGRFASVASRDPRFKGKGLAEAIRISTAMAPDEREAVFGSTERAYRGMGVLVENAEQFGQTLAEINRAIAATGPGDRASQAIALAARDPLIASMTAAQRQAAGRELAEMEAFAPEQHRREAIRDYLFRQKEFTDLGAFDRFGMKMQFGLYELLGLDPEGIPLRSAAGMLSALRAEAGDERFIGPGRAFQGIGAAEEEIRSHALERSAAHLENAAQALDRSTPTIINPGPLEE